MTDQGIGLPRPDQQESWILNVAVTSKCPQKCSHCAPMSGPTGNQTLSLDTLEPVFDEIAAMDCKLVNFTGGGEPFALGSALPQYVRAAAARVGTVRVSTSGYWAKSGRVSATRLVRALKSAGLAQMALSTSSSHLEFIGMDTFGQAVSASLEGGLHVFVQVAVEKISQTLPDAVRKHLLTAGIPCPAMVVVPVVPVGRADTWDADRFLNRPYEEFEGPCRSVQKHLMIHPTGNVTSCSSVVATRCAAFVHGNIQRESFRSIYDRIRANPCTTFVRHAGVVALRQLIERNAGHTMFRDKYVNICDLCQDLFTGEGLQALQRIALLPAHPAVV